MAAATKQYVRYIRKTAPLLQRGCLVEWRVSNRNWRSGRVHAEVSPGALPDLEALAAEGSLYPAIRTDRALVPRAERSYIVAVPGRSKPHFYWPDARKLRAVKEGAEAPARV